MIYEGLGFIYDSDTGGMIHSKNKSNLVEKYGALSIKKNKRGESLTTLRGKTTKQSAVAWEMVNGPIPDGFIVLYKQKNATNPNRIENLKLVPSKSGSKGLDVWKNQGGRGYGAAFMFHGRRVFLGWFNTEKYAIDAAIKAKDGYVHNCEYTPKNGCRAKRFQNAEGEMCSTGCQNDAAWLVGALSAQSWFLCEQCAGLSIFKRRRIRRQL